MIDLNSLTLYKEKISSYLDDQMPLPSPKDVLILNDELIKNYTGKGITKNGNVKIDEKGIATTFTNRTDYVVTNLDILDLKLPLEVQIKFKVSNKAAFNQLILISNKTYPYPYFELALAKGKIVFESFINQSYDVNELFYDSFDFDENKWYVLNMKHEQKGIYECTVYNEQYKELYNKTQNSNYEINYHYDKIILGNDIDFASGSAKLQIDLSETYFKNGDTIISEWNI